MQGLRFLLNVKLALSCLYILTFLFAFSALSQEQNVTHTVFGKEDGISLDTINDLVFDDDGFLWLCGSILDSRDIILGDRTLMLQRFNGNTFHNIPIPEAFDVNSVESFYKRLDGNFILLVNNTDLVHFNPFTTQFSSIKLDADYFSQVIQIQGKEYIIGQRKRQLTLFELHENLSATPLFSFTSSENKFVVGRSTHVIKLKNHWLIGDHNFAIKVFTEDGTLVKEIGVDENKELDVIPRILRIGEVFNVGDKKALFFKNNNTTLHYIDQEKLDILPLNIPNNKLNISNIKLLKDTKGNELLFSEFDGNIRFNSVSEGEGVTSWYRKQQFNRSVATHPISLNLKEDLWMATSSGELHYYKFPKKNVTRILPEYEFRAISQLEKNSYLLATEANGWHILNREDLSTKKVNFGDEIDPGFPNSSRNFIKDGSTIWSNSSSGMIRANLMTKDFKYYRYHPISALEQINDSIILCGTNKFNLLEFNIRRETFKDLLKTDTLNMHDLAYNKKKQQLAVATSQGLLMYNTATKEHTFYNDPKQLKNTYLLMVDYHPEYGFLLGTREGKIISFNENTKTFTTIYEDVLKAGIATILPRDDIWWVSTFNGYVRWNTKQNTVTRFSTKDGFSHNEANRYSALDIGDELLIGSISGINLFNPKKILPKKNRSQITLLKTRSYNKAERSIKDVLDRSTFSENQSIKLPAEFKEFQIEYALTHNIENRPHSFQYRLNKEAWTNVGQEQQIRFPNMAAGTYLLQIEALDFSGKRIGKTLQVGIDSKDFFYRTWWFYLLISSVAVLLLLYFLWQSRIKQSMQEKFSVDLLTSQEKERNHIAKELHDSVGQQLTLIKRKAQQKGEHDLTTLTNTVLEEVRGISRGLYPANLKLLGLTESIEQLVYDLDEQTDTFFSVEVAPVDDFFNETETLNIFRFVQECLANSLKHSNATAAEVEVLEKPKTIVLKVSDNGKGFNIANATLQHSLGLKTLAERIKIVKGTLDIQSRQGEGTAITAIIPKK